LKLLFAWRYFKSKKSTTAINIISWISVAAITVVSAALIIVFSVFNGFEDLVKSLYADFYADARVLSVKGKTIHLSQLQIQQLQSAECIANISLVAEERALFVNGDYQSIVLLKGVDSNNNSVNSIAKHIELGKYGIGTVDAPKLILGTGIGNTLRVDVEKALYPITIYLPNKKSHNLKSLDEALNSYNLFSSATFTVQQEFDNKYAFTNLAFLKYMLDFKPDEYSYVELKLKEGYTEGEVKAQISKVLGNSFKIETRYHQNQSLYSAMQVEKWVIYGVTCLILTIAAFNIIGSLTMLVLEKQKDIAVLKAMGATNYLVQNIFLNEGILLAVIGAFLGVSIATVVCLVQLKFKFIKLGGGTFIIDYYPVKLIWTDYIVVITTVLVIALVAAFFPSRKASLQQFTLKS